MSDKKCQNYVYIERYSFKNKTKQKAKNKTKQQQQKTKTNKEKQNKTKQNKNLFALTVPTYNLFDPRDMDVVISQLLPCFIPREYPTWTSPSLSGILWPCS